MKCHSLFLLAAILTLQTFGGGKVIDRFGRDVTTRGIELTDWEGQIANPALQYYLSAPHEMEFPVQAVMRVNGQRVYFEAQRSQNTITGPSRAFTLDDPFFAEPFLISIFPDHDTADESYQATVTFTDANGANQTLNIPVRVRDQDRVQENSMRIIVDFTQDRTSFFTTNSARRQIVQQAADDWAYFFEDTFDEVNAYTEISFIWNENGQVTGRRVANTQAYRGFLLYAYGVFHPNIRSGGQGSYDGGLQSINGAATGLRRSGGYFADPRGNYNQLGWFLSESDDDWWRSGNFGNEANDLASIAHHEIGHAIGFDRAHTAFAGANGVIQSQRLQAYYGDGVPFDGNSHLNGIEDPASRKGVFGWEYYGTMPRRRWLITKLDLLCLEALGYKLRSTTAFQSLDANSTRPPEALIATSYSHDFGITGGVAPYHCEIQSGELPPGIQIDPFTGALTGASSQSGEFSAILRVLDSGNPQLTKTVPFEIKSINQIKFELAGARKLPNGGLSAQVTAGSSIEPYVIESSTDMIIWSPVSTNQAGGNYQFQDTRPGASSRFYRAIIR